jgi:phosphoglycolate phosphatase-like HAD superfamily hydrolase
LSRTRGTVIFDVDGTLCDVRSIRFHVDPNVIGFSGKKNFDRFHAASEWAPANPWVSRLLTDLARRDFRIAIVTGREERWADLTERWLASNGIHFDVIYYRPEKDGQRDAEVKGRHLAHLRQTGSVLLAVDDSPSVIEMWRANSVPVVVVDSDAAPVKLDTSATELDAGLSVLLKRHHLTR